MSRLVRAALNQTVNAYPDMPASVSGLSGLRDRLEDVRRANVAHHLELMDRLGLEPPWGRSYFGESYFVGPSGVAKDLSPAPRLVVAALDLAELTGSDPSGWRLAGDARPEIYSPRPGRD